MILIKQASAGACLDVTNVVATTTVNGDICSSAGITTGANSAVYGDVTSVAAATIGATSTIYGSLSAGGAITLGANAVVTGTAYSATSVYNYGAGASVNGVVMSARQMNKVCYLPLLQLLLYTYA